MKEIIHALIIITMLIMLIIVLSTHYIEKINVHFKFEKLEKNIKNFNKLYKLQQYLIKRLNLFTTSYEKSIAISNFYILSYFIYILVIAVLCILNKEVWYYTLVLVALLVVIPLLIFKAIIDRKYNNILKDFSVKALDEFQFWIFIKQTIPDTIKEVADNLEGNISYPFLMLYYNFMNNNSEALEIFKKTFDNYFVDTFCELIETYLSEGDLMEFTNQISELTSNMQSELNFNKKTSDRLSKYKIGSVFMLIMVMGSKILLNKIFPETSGLVQIKYDSYNLLSGYIVLYYLFIFILERI